MIIGTGITIINISNAKYEIVRPEVYNINNKCHVYTCIELIIIKEHIKRTLLKTQCAFNNKYSQDTFIDNVFSFTK